MILEEINQYIREKESKINNQYRLKYHMSPRVGWMNDPNGLVFYHGQYHLYYQANPYRTRPGHMMWGHFVSSDLISFKDEGIALALEKEGENAYSGGAIVDEDKINIFYTLHTEKQSQEIRYDGDILEGVEILTEKENEKRKTAPRPIEGLDVKCEEVYHSISDGYSYDKGELVFDNESLPKNISRADFRDPCPVRIKDTYYIFIGGKDLNTNKGVIIVLKSKNLHRFEYAFLLGPYYELGDMAECPCYFKVDDKDVLLVSGSNTVRRDNDFKNINCSVFIVGDLDFEKGTMKVDFIKEIDKGPSFYAPQFIRDINKPVMVGWLEMWSKKYPTSIFKHGYVGAFSIPRLISIKNNDVYQWPIDELEKYEKEIDGDIIPRTSDIYLELEKGSSLILKGGNGSLFIGNDERGVYFDNRNGNSMYESIRHTNNQYDNASLRILLDISSIEIFVENGKEVISDRFYIDGKWTLETNGIVKNIKVKEIGDKQ